MRNIFLCCLPRCCTSCCDPRGRHRRLSDAEDDEDLSFRIRPLSDFFSSEELANFGNLANQVKVQFDKNLPPSLHGTSRWENGVPLAIINPQAPDPRYVILHELMHHQLDDMGCPALVCQLSHPVPLSSWMSLIRFEAFAQGLLCVLWELVQHSRFNRMLLRVYNCSPASARDKEYQRYLDRGTFPTIGLAGPSGDPRLWMLAAAGHVVVISLEGTEEMVDKVKRFIRNSHRYGPNIVELGERIAGLIVSKDLTFAELSPEQRELEFQHMVHDMLAVLEALGSGMEITCGDFKSVAQKIDNRCHVIVPICFRPSLPRPPANPSNAHPHLPSPAHPHPHPLPDAASASLPPHQDPPGPDPWALPPPPPPPLYGENGALHSDNGALHAGAVPDLYRSAPPEGAWEGGGGSHVTPVPLPEPGHVGDRVTASADNVLSSSDNVPASSVSPLIGMWQRIGAARES